MLSFRGFVASHAFTAEPPYIGDGVSFSSPFAIFSSNTPTITSSSNSKLNGPYVLSFTSHPNGPLQTALFTAFTGGTSNAIGFVSGSNYGTSNSVPNSYNGNAFMIINGSQIRGDSVSIRFPNPVSITDYSIYWNTSGGTRSSDRYPYSFYFVGSNDGSTWIQLDYVSRTPVNPTSRSFSNTTYYRFYAFLATQANINATGLGGHIRFDQINFTGKT